MRICDFTKPELEYFRNQCNFTDEEMQYFELKSKNKTNVAISMAINISERQITNIARRVRSKIARVQKRCPFNSD